MKLFAGKTSRPAPPRRPRVPQTPAEWCEEGALAEEHGDWSRAVVCYRRALQQAPFNQRIRLAFEEALEGQILAAGEDLAPRETFARAGVSSRRPTRDEIDVEESFRTIFDEFPDEDGEEEEPEIRTPAGRITMPPRRRPPVWSPPSPPRWVRMPVALSLGIFIALLGLGAAGVAASALSGVFRPGDLAEIGTDEVPTALVEKLTDANRALADGEHDDAVEILREAKEEFPGFGEEIAPTLSQALRLAAAAHMRGNDFGSASQLLREATEVEPRNALAWMDLGRALRDSAILGDDRYSPAEKRRVLADAGEAYRRALAVEGNDSSALLGLAQVYAAQNDRGRAVETYEKILRLESSGSEKRLAEMALSQLRRR